MKRIPYITLIVFSLSVLPGCKKFLNVDPPSDLSGNNFWLTRQDVESFTNGNYELFRQSVTRFNMQAGAGANEYPYLPFAGEIRGGMARENTGGATGARTYIADLSNNNIRRFVDFVYSGNNWRSLFNHVRFTQWDRYYRCIAAANIAVDRIDGVPDPNMTADMKAAYKGEAIFIRNLAYFFMVRQFGDVAYYTKPYFSDPMKRTPMVQVLKSCIADMKSAYKGMYWTYDDPFYVGIRGMRGAAIALMMEMNLWLAGFDNANAAAYYNEVITLAQEARNESGNAYELLPLDRYVEIFKGRSKENLFGIPQNRNYGERFGWSDFFDQVKYDPIQRGSNNTIPYMSYNANFMRALYPEGLPDRRADLWFERTSIFSENRNFAMKKFLVTSDPNSIDFNDRNDATQCVYRYADIFLMQAEAYAELGNEAMARQTVNLIRARAGAQDITETGADLREQIFLERAREFIGEGHYWFDCVRSRRIIDLTYDYCVHVTVEQFRQGAWTWPIDRSALLNNPEMTLNNYWE